MPALRHGLGERDGDALPDTGDAPSSEPPIDRIPLCAAETYERRSNDLTIIWKLFER